MPACCPRAPHTAAVPALQIPLRLILRDATLICTTAGINLVHMLLPLLAPEPYLRQRCARCRCPRTPVCSSHTSSCVARPTSPDPPFCSCFVA